MSEFTSQSTEPTEKEGVFAAAAQDYLDKIIREDYGAEVQGESLRYGGDIGVRFGEEVAPYQAETYRNLLAIDELVKSGGPESSKQELFLESTRAEIAVMETYRTIIPHETSARAFDGVEEGEREALLASAAHDVRREVQKKIDEAEQQGDSNLAAELRAKHRDLRVYERISDEEAAGETKIVDRNVRNEHLDSLDGSGGFYDRYRSMQEIAAMDRVEAEYLPDMLQRIADKRETEKMKRQIEGMNVSSSRTTSQERPMSRSERIDTIREEEMQRIYSNPEEVAAVVADAQEDFQENWLKKARANYGADPSEQNTKTLNMFERDVEGFELLEEFAGDWQAEKQRNTTTLDFATYMEDMHTSAESELHDAFSTTGGNRLPAGNEKAEAFDRINKAYRTGFTSGRQYSLSKRIERRASKAAMERVGHSS